MARRTPSQLNMLLAVDKPVGCTSHDVVSQCRRALHERRVGHAGTLDPAASGVLVVGIGQATKLLGLLNIFAFLGSQLTLCICQFLAQGALFTLGLFQLVLVTNEGL